MIPQDLEKQLAILRPQLHRYCARMVGSTVDAEDIVQDACLKAMAAWDGADLTNPDGWLFRIAHNTTLDFLRRRRMPPAEDPDVLETSFAAPTPDPGAATASIQIFLRLPPLQRSAVVMKDVIGHSLEEIAEINGVSPSAAKSALQRGRASLRAFLNEPEDAEPPALTAETRRRLIAYVDGFRTGDFDAVRAMLAEDVRLDLVSRLTRTGKSEVGDYYGRYAESRQWAFAPGLVEGRPAMLIYDRGLSLDHPASFVSLIFSGGQVAGIRDFLFARYATEGVRMVDLPP